MKNTPLNNRLTKVATHKSILSITEEDKALDKRLANINWVVFDGYATKITDKGLDAFKQMKGEI